MLISAGNEVVPALQERKGLPGVAHPVPMLEKDKTKTAARFNVVIASVDASFESLDFFWCQRALGIGHAQLEPCDVIRKAPEQRGHRVASSIKVAQAAIAMARETFEEVRILRPAVVTLFTKRSHRVVAPRTNQITDEIVHRLRPFFIEFHCTPEMRLRLIKPTKTLELRRDIGMRRQIIDIDRQHAFEKIDGLFPRAQALLGRCHPDQGDQIRIVFFQEVRVDRQRVARCILLNQQICQIARRYRVRRCKPRRRAKRVNRLLAHPRTYLSNAQVQPGAGIAGVGFSHMPKCGNRLYRPPGAQIREPEIESRRQISSAAGDRLLEATDAIFHLAHTELSDAKMCQ